MAVVLFVVAGFVTWRAAAPLLLVQPGGGQLSAPTLTTPESRVRASRPGVDGASLRKRTPLVFVADHALLIALAVIFIAPFVFVLLTAVMSPEQARHGVRWPTSWHWDNFAQVFEKMPMLKYFGNSFLYAGLATLFMLLSSVPAAYALARIQFRGSKLLMFAIIGAMLLPPQVTTVPLYVMWSNLGLTGTLWPLILPNLLGDAFSIFLLRQFFLTIPREYPDAARIDGCGEWRTLWKVVLPMARPGIAATVDLPVLRVLERLLRAAALHVRERERLDGLLRARVVPRVAHRWSGT